MAKKPNPFAKMSKSADDKWDKSKGVKEDSPKDKKLDKKFVKKGK